MPDALHCCLRGGRGQPPMEAPTTGYAPCPDGGREPCAMININKIYYYTALQGEVSFWGIN